MSPALTDIEKYNNVVGVAGGPHKIEAIYAVLQENIWMFSSQMKYRYCSIRSLSIKKQYRH